MWTGVKNPAWDLPALLQSPLKLKSVFERGKGALFRANLQYWSLIYLCGGWGKAFRLCYTSICQQPQLRAAFLFILVLTEDKKKKWLYGWDYNYCMAEITSGAVEFLRGEIVKALPGVFLKDLGFHSAVTGVSPPLLFSPPAARVWLHSLSSARLPAGGKCFSC